jgi:hypothetical protein
VTNRTRQSCASSFRDFVADSKLPQHKAQANFRTPKAAPGVPQTSLHRDVDPKSVIRRSVEEFDATRDAITGGE